MSIQAQKHKHASIGLASQKAILVEHENEKKGASAYLAAQDV